MVKDELNESSPQKPLSDTALAAWEDKINQEIKEFLAARKGDRYSDEMDKYPPDDDDRAT